MTLSFPVRRFSGVALATILSAVLTLATTPLADARGTKSSRKGFTKFAAKYAGGYAVTDPLQNLTGPGKAIFKSSRNGLSARLQWKNTFYDRRGSFVIAVTWRFNSNGTMTATSINPSVNNQSGVGTYTIKGRRIIFSCTAGDGQTLTGEIRLVGGGALNVNATIPATSVGDVTFTYSAARKNR